MDRAGIDTTLLITTSFPRSGSVYLNYAIRELYYPNEFVNSQNHSVNLLSSREKILVPFRNPLDCISSWNLFLNKFNIKDDIKLYLRFHTAVLKNINNTVLMDFNTFTHNIDYIKHKIFETFGISTNNSVTDAQVKKAMLANDKSLNLPRNNKEELDAVKAELQQMPEFAECLGLYARLKKL